MHFAIISALYTQVMAVYRRIRNAILCTKCKGKGIYSPQRRFEHQAQPPPLDSSRQPAHNAAFGIAQTAARICRHRRRF